MNRDHKLYAVYRRKFLWTVTGARLARGAPFLLSLCLFSALAFGIVAAILSHFDNRVAHASRHVSEPDHFAIRFNLPVARSFTLDKFQQSDLVTYRAA